MAAISYGCIGRSLSKLRTDRATGVRGIGRGARFLSARGPPDSKAGDRVILISDYSTLSIQHRLTETKGRCGCARRPNPTAAPVTIRSVDAPADPRRSYPAGTPRAGGAASHRALDASDPGTGACTRGG